MNGHAVNTVTLTGWRKDLPAFLVIAAAFVFYVATIHPGHDWGGDFGLYIAHAKNIATAHHYSDTGFVYNPYEPFLSPRSYPPVFPLILAPVYAAFGLDLHAMKVANILVFCIFLLLFYRYSTQRLETQLGQLVLLALVAFSPWYWEGRNIILPDYAFLLFLHSTMYFVDSRFGPGKGAGFQWPVAILAGLLIYLSYGTRSVGMLLVPAMLLLDVVRFRALRKATLVAAVLFSVCYMAQNAWLHTDASYLESIVAVAEDDDEDVVTDAGARVERPQESVPGCGRPCVIVEELLSRIPSKLHYYGMYLVSYWENGVSRDLRRAVFFAVGLLSVIGFFTLIVRRPSLGDYFILTYVAVLLVVPFVQERYMLPLVPLYLLYAVRGIERIAEFRPAGNVSGSRLRVVMLALFLGIAAPSYAVKYTRFGYEAIESGVESTASREMFEFIRTSTPVDSQFVFHKPRPLALFTGRRACIYHWEPNPDKLWNDLIGLGATHIIVPKYIPPTIHTKYFRAMVEHYRGSLDTVFENSDYVIYRMRMKGS